MDKETLQELAERLQEVVDWRKSSDHVEMAVNITDDEYYVDFGVLGELPIYVEVRDDYYPISVNEVMDSCPQDLEGLLSDLREAIEKPSVSSLDEVLGKMVESPVEEEAKLAIALKAVIGAMQGFSTAVVGAPADPSVLPATPMPWPGALREDIDYTADDFPLRYQPPPGYDWAGETSSTQATTYQGATKETCEKLRKRLASETGCMVMDNKGRVSWSHRDSDDLSDDKGRWRIWFFERDGVPMGTGNFNSSTKPLAIDQDGYPMESWTSSTGRSGENAAWNSDSEAERARQRLQQIRDQYEWKPAGEKPKEAFEPPASVSI